MSIKQSITTTIGRQGLKLKKNSPHILFAVGLVGTIGSTVLACRATLKLEGTIDEIRASFEEIHTKHAIDKKYDTDEYRRDLTYAYINGTTKLVKLYGPSVVIGGLSIAALTGSHVQLTNRNAALTAALTTVSRAYDEYRARVRNDVGEEKELEYYQGCLEDSDELEEMRKTGKVVNHASPYGRYFDSSNMNWQPDHETNYVFIHAVQSVHNDLLNARGHVFLNDVYDALGMERSPQGAVVGWLKRDPDDPKGDGYIDFGIHTPANIAFVNGELMDCLLDFNVDGVIFEDI